MNGQGGNPHSMVLQLIWFPPFFSTFACSLHLVNRITCKGNPLKMIVSILLTILYQCWKILQNIPTWKWPPVMEAKWTFIVISLLITTWNMALLDKNFFAVTAQKWLPHKCNFCIHRRFEEEIMIWDNNESCLGF